MCSRLDAIVSHVGGESARRPSEGPVVAAIGGKCREDEDLAAIVDDMRPEEAECTYIRHSA